jgi:hypothetical protein
MLIKIYYSPEERINLIDGLNIIEIYHLILLDIGLIVVIGQMLFLNIQRNPITWKINKSISYSDIRNTVLFKKSNKAYGPKGILIEFYNALF